MDLEYRDDIRDDEALRASFNALTRRVFGFDFADWHAGGWWTDERTGYTPHALVCGGQVAANVSATPISFQMAGETLRALQLGTVMTAPEWRGQGLQRRLMARVLDEAAGQYDMIYLYANESVMAFYPKFGFVPATEYAFSRPMPEGRGALSVPADMSGAADRGRLLRLYEQGNPFSAAAVRGETGLLMFYCAGFMSGSVYFIDALNAAAVAEYEDGALLLHDVFCPAGVSLEDVLGGLARPGIGRVEFGFTPKDAAGMSCAPVEEDGGLFVMKGLKNPFAGRKMRLPTLSHT
ncbi:MAG: GNAT family N-acetyltransferase [Clostridia bacterium]|nr:GNAT family N-acetyltransferase [Clostridia bacterium]